MAGITLTIDVDDKGTVKVKQFADEAKRAMKEMTDGPKAAQGPLASLQEGWIGLTAKVAIGTAAFYAAKRMIYDTSKEIASAGNDIARMSRTFNMSTDDLQKWSFAARMADVDIEGFGQGFKFLTRSMGEALQGSGDAAKAFNLLGINLKDTTDKTKDQQTVLMEIIGSFEKYADGVNRDALMLAVFGRGWMSLKPLIDQGTKAIEENKKEAERLNAILGKDTIRVLSESEDAFKKWEMVWKVAKAETFQPMITIFTSMVERVLALRNAFKESGFKGVFQDILAAQEEQRINVLPPAAWTKGWVAGWKPPTKPEAAGLAGAGEYPEWRNIMGEERVQYEKDYWEAQQKTWEIENNLIKIEGERAQQLADDMFPSMDKVRAITEEMTRMGEEQREKLIEIQNLVKDFGWEDYASGAADASDAAMRETNRMARAAQYSVSGMESTWQELGNTINSVWSQNVTGILKGTTTVADAFKNMATGMGDAFISAVTKMITKWILFQDVQGTYKSGAGLIGMVGSWFGGGGGPELLGQYQHGGILPGSWEPIHAFAQGGMVTRPTLGMIGEGGGSEAVIPLKGGKIPIEGGRGDTYVNNTFIQATDVDSFARRYGGVIESIYYKGKRFNKMSMRGQ